MIKHRESWNGIVRHNRRMPGREKKLRLDMSENICSPFREEDIRAVLAGVDNDFLSTYPDYTDLIAKLAARLGLAEGNFLLTNGSDSAAKLIADTFVSPGETVVITRPTFAMHKVYAQLANAKIREIDYRADYAFPTEVFMDAIAAGAKLAILVSPVNPFGTEPSQADLQAILASAEKKNTLVYLDEAYAEFAGSGQIELVKRHPNLVVTRSFSKAYGISALRLGYAAAAPAIIDALRLSQPTFDVNQLAVRFGEYVLDHPEILERTRAGVAEGKRWIERELKQMGLKHHAGHGNFMLIEVGAAEAKVRLVAELAARGVLVTQDVGFPGLESYIRITLGPPDCMERFICELRAVFARLFPRS